MDYPNCGFTQNGLLDKLKTGLSSEKQALSLCSELLLLVETDSEREALKVIIADEKRHIEITENLILMTKNFYTKTEKF